jgi:hypothetical protein
MKKIVALGTTIMLCIPFAAGAVSYTNIVTSSTGGVTAPSGASVSGNSDASADVQTTMTSGNGGTDSQTVIETNSDGVVHTQTIHKTAPLSGQADMYYATSSNGTDVRVHMSAGIGAGTKSGTSTFSGKHAPWSASTSASISVQSAAQGGFLHNLWQRLLRLFGFF